MLPILSKTLAVAILLFLFFVAGGGVSQNLAWRITEIKIVGTQAVSAEDILKLVQEKLQGQYFFAYARNNGFIFPREEISGALRETFPRIKEAHISRIGAHTLSLEVAERKPAMLWCGETFGTKAPLLLSCWFMDDFGFVFDRAPIFSQGVYKEIYGALMLRDAETPLRGVIPSPRFAFARSVEQGIEHELGGVSRVFIKENGEYGIFIEESPSYPSLAGAEIRFKDGQSTERLMRNLRAALPVQFSADSIPQKKLLYIELRFGNKVFFGFEE